MLHQRQDGECSSSITSSGAESKGQAIASDQRRQRWHRRRRCETLPLCPFPSSSVACSLRAPFPPLTEIPPSDANTKTEDIPFDLPSSLLVVAPLPRPPPPGPPPAPVPVEHSAAFLLRHRQKKKKERNDLLSATAAPLRSSYSSSDDEEEGEESEEEAGHATEEAIAAATHEARRRKKQASLDEDEEGDGERVFRFFLFFLFPPSSSVLSPSYNRAFFTPRPPLQKQETPSAGPSGGSTPLSTPPKRNRRSGPRQRWPSPAGPPGLQRQPLPPPPRRQQQGPQGSLPGLLFLRGSGQRARPSGRPPASLPRPRPTRLIKRTRAEGAGRRGRRRGAEGFFGGGGAFSSFLHQSTRSSPAQKHSQM